MSKWSSRGLPQVREAKARIRDTFDSVGEICRIGRETIDSTQISAVAARRTGEEPLHTFDPRKPSSRFRHTKFEIGRRLQSWFIGVRRFAEFHTGVDQIVSSSVSEAAVFDRRRGFRGSHRRDSILLWRPAMLRWRGGLGGGFLVSWGAIVYVAGGFAEGSRISRARWDAFAHLIARIAEFRREPRD